MIAAANDLRAASARCVVAGQPRAAGRLVAVASLIEDHRVLVDLQFNHRVHGNGRVTIWLDPRGWHQLLRELPALTIDRMWDGALWRRMVIVDSLIVVARVQGDMVGDA